MSNKHLSVLVIEDNEGDFVLIEDYLIESYIKIHIEHCVDFSTAKDSLKQNNNKYIAILLDLNLPDLSGVELINEVLKICKDTPVIVLTGYADINMARKSLEIGVYDFLIKDEINSSLLQKSIDFSLSRKNFISQLESERENYKQLFNFSPESIWVYDSKTYQILDINIATLNQYEYTLDELRDMHIYDLFPTEHVHHFMKKLDLSSDKQKSTYSGVFRLKKKTGELVTVEIYSADIKYLSRNCKMILSFDITEKKKLLEEIQVTSYEVEKRERERVSLSLHNGLQQILVASLIRINLINTKIEDVLDEPSYLIFEEGVKLLKEGIQTARTVAHELMPIEIEEQGLSFAIETILERYSSLKLKFKYEKNYDLESLSSNLKIIIFRMIQEVVNNIIKHAEASEANIQLNEKNKMLFLQISDNGKGFDAEHIQSKSLGLRSLKSMVNLVDGMIKINSSPGKGTTLKITLPIQ